MTEPLIDALLYFVLIGGAVAVAGTLGYGIYRLAGKIHCLDRESDWEDRRVFENRQYMRRRLG